jgi:hypothetical protein
MRPSKDKESKERTRKAIAKKLGTCTGWCC